MVQIEVIEKKLMQAEVLSGQESQLVSVLSLHEANAAIQKSLDKGRGYATPLISTGVQLEHTASILVQMIGEARKGNSAADMPHVIEFLKYAVPLVSRLKEEVVKAVGKAGAYVNLGNGIQQVMGKKFLGIDPSAIRWYVENERVSQQYGQKMVEIRDGTKSIKPEFMVVNHYTHILAQSIEVQGSSAYHVEFDNCGSRGKTSCDTLEEKCSQQPTQCSNSGCAFYQTCQQYKKPEMSGAPTKSCDEKHAQQGLVVGTLANLDNLSVLETVAKMTKEKLTSEGTAIYRRALDNVSTNLKVLQMAFSAYLKELKPVLIATRPY